MLVDQGEYYPLDDSVRILPLNIENSVQRQTSTPVWSDALAGHSICAQEK